MRTLLIDGDEYLFKATSAVEREIRWDEWNHVLCANRVEAWDNFTRLIEQLFERFETSDHVLCFSGAVPYFRSALLPDYKSGRSRKPLCYTDLRVKCDDEYNVQAFPHLEADDVMGILATQPGKHDRIIISQDKDMKCVPCLLSRDGHEWALVSSSDADYWHLFQTLVGDKTDGYSGCPGVGPVKAEAILRTCPTPEWWWGAVVQAYEKAGLTEADALTQARVARILRWSDWDKDKKEPILWTPVATAAG